MKKLILFFIFLSSMVQAMEKVQPAPSAVTEKKTPKALEKTPKSLFLIKKIKVSPDVGEPQFDPAEAQLRTIINDTALQNTKKFE